jgi:hypothetical protein
MRKFIIGGGVAVALALGGGVAVADSTPDCKDIGHQVLVGPDDPYSLDRDGDGVGCESYPGPATPLDVDDPSPAVDQPKDDAKPELAQTGSWGPAEHPVRWMGATGALLVGGVAVTFYSRRKEVCRNES